MLPTTLDATAAAGAAEPEKPNGSDDDVLAAARTFLRERIGAESTDRAEALDDLRFLKGGANQWPAETAKSREIEKRPALTINKLPTFLHQVTNDQRQNTPGIKVHPVDDGADVETAKVLQGMIRHIEYSSNADVAYDTAVNSGAACGRGYFRLITEYEDERSFNQVIRFRRIRNPFSVYFGEHQEADGSDCMQVMLTANMRRSEFKLQYPQASAGDSGLENGLGDAITEWFSEHTVRVAEFYRVEQTPAKLVLLSDGTTAWKDEVPEGLPAGVSVVQERDSLKRVVRWYLVTGAEVLDQADIPCRWIPVFPVYGDELDIEGEVTRSGIVRHAKDPARMYNFWMTAATEEVSLRPKTPFVMAEGQDEGFEAEWASANTRSYSRLRYKPVTIGGQLAPPPQRQPMADVPVGVLQMAMHASDNIKATTGLFDSSLGARGTATSGRQEIAQQRQGDVANFHFTDNLARAIRHAGRCIVDMIPRVYDTERIVSILGEDRTPGHAAINKPMEQPKVDPKTGAVQKVLNDVRVGRYDVTVRTGPGYDTQRQEAVAAMTEVGGKWPKLMDVAGDKVIRAMDWPGADEIADRIKRTIPAEILGDEENGGAPNQLPPEVQQQLQQLEAANQQLQAQLQEAANGIEKARIDAASRERVAEINATAKQDAEELKGLVQLLLQRMQPPPVLVDQALRTGEPDTQDPASAGSVVSGPQDSRATGGQPSNTAPMTGQPGGIEPGQEFAQ